MVVYISHDKKERERLDQVVKDHGIEALEENLPLEVTVITPCFGGMDCERYAIGTVMMRRHLPNIFPEVRVPEEGDIVLYHSEEYGITHVAVYQEDGSAVSKWGIMGPVLKHPLDLVLYSYGETRSFIRIPDQEMVNLKSKIGTRYVLDKVYPKRG